ncbi:MAG TPA: hypothetical protein VGP46_14135, partial [Acidimicrobiales bacterium]|nr:hypothetical protein [Acidimicrobiales bacterium]
AFDAATSGYPIGGLTPSSLLDEEEVRDAPLRIAHDVSDSSGNDETRYCLGVNVIMLLGASQELSHDTSGPLCLWVSSSHVFTQIQYSWRQHITASVAPSTEVTIDFHDYGPSISITRP